MQLHWMAGIKAEVVDVGTGAGAGTFLHPVPNSSNGFTVIDQFIEAELR